MKTKITLLTICLLFISSFSFAQKKDKAKSIINNKVNIKKYHTHAELDNMQKGELIKLYMERIQVLSGTIPYIAFATKPGITMSTLGIPNSSENRKSLENQTENTDDYLENTLDFQKKLLPYSDTKKIAKAIFFYEEIMKSLHAYDEFN